MEGRSKSQIDHSSETNRDSQGGKKSLLTSQSESQISRAARFSKENSTTSYRNLKTLISETDRKELKIVLHNTNFRNRFDAAIKELASIKDAITVLKDTINTQPLFQIVSELEKNSSAFHTIKKLRSFLANPSFKQEIEKNIALKNIAIRLTAVIVELTTLSRFERSLDALLDIQDGPLKISNGEIIIEEGQLIVPSMTATGETTKQIISIQNGQIQPSHVENVDIEIGTLQVTKGEISFDGRRFRIDNLTVNISKGTLDASGRLNLIEGVLLTKEGEFAQIYRKKEQLANNCPGYAAYLEDNGALGDYVIADIFMCETFEEAIYAIEFWANVLDNLLALGDINSAYSINGALSVTEIVRLRGTNARGDDLDFNLSPNTRLILQRASVFFSGAKRQEALRKAMVEGTIPNLSIITQDIEQLKNSEIDKDKGAKVDDFFTAAQPHFRKARSYKSALKKLGHENLFIKNEWENIPQMVQENKHTLTTLVQNAEDVYWERSTSLFPVLADDEKAKAKRRKQIDTTIVPNAAIYYPSSDMIQTLRQVTCEKNKSQFLATAIQSNQKELKILQAELDKLYAAKKLVEVARNKAKKEKNKNLENENEDKYIKLNQEIDCKKYAIQQKELTLKHLETNKKELGSNFNFLARKTLLTKLSGTKEKRLSVGVTLDFPLQREKLNRKNSHRSLGTAGGEVMRDELKKMRIEELENLDTEPTFKPELKRADTMRMFSSDRTRLTEKMQGATLQKSQSHSHSAYPTRKRQ